MTKCERTVDQQFLINHFYLEIDQGTIQKFQKNLPNQMIVTEDILTVETTSLTLGWVRFEIPSFILLCSGIFIQSFNSSLLVFQMTTTSKLGSTTPHDVVGLHVLHDGHIHHTHVLGSTPNFAVLLLEDEVELQPLTHVIGFTPNVVVLLHMHHMHEIGPNLHTHVLGSTTPNDVVGLHIAKFFTSANAYKFCLTPHILVFDSSPNWFGWSLCTQFNDDEDDVIILTGPLMESNLEAINDRVEELNSTFMKSPWSSFPIKGTWIYVTNGCS